MKNSTKATIAVTGAAAGLAAYLAKVTRTNTPDKERTTPERLIDYVHSILPTEDAILQEPSEEWDWILGGRIGKDTWKLYQWAPKAAYGTTCGIFAAAALVRAQGPKELINRDPPEGSGYAPRMHIARLFEGAKKLDKLVHYGANTGPLKPGDIYCQLRDTTWQNKPLKMEHVGIIVTPEDEQGVLWTADGGQTAPSGRQCAKLVKRKRIGTTLRAMTYNTDAELSWLVRL